MPPIGSILVDFDGTACLHDVSEHLLVEFGDPSWRAYDEAVDRGEIGLREAAHRQAALLTGSRGEMLTFALEHCPLDPTFAPFVSWSEERGLSITLVSDGFAFYIRPMLEAAGLAHLEVVTNELATNGGSPELRHPNGHPTCIGCGTCKMLAVRRSRERHGPVAFIGEGQSDRYGAIYADLVFAKDALARIAGDDGVPFLPWETFDDVRAEIDGLETVPAPVGGDPCPGWIDP